jgi:OOP family OmpA-OmpF porin
MPASYQDDASGTPPGRRWIGARDFGVSSVPVRWWIVSLAFAAGCGSPQRQQGELPSNAMPPGLPGASAPRPNHTLHPRAGDRDGDDIPDPEDKCPDAPEDFDGFQDEDGCPDPDNDQDGIPDVDDKCPNVPGPRPDGCPHQLDGDRDGDGIPDPTDKCPDDPEDFDGFQDADGCPDPDNDHDGIPDVDDLCPNEPGPASNNGCPVAH